MCPLQPKAHTPTVEHSALRAGSGWPDPQLEASLAPPPSLGLAPGEQLAVSD